MRKYFDLERRTFEFAKNVYKVCKKVSVNTFNKEYLSQLIKASGSVGANYIEANESLSKKDFIYRIKICRKESKESAYWLKLIIETNNVQNDELIILENEAIQLKKIFSSIVENSRIK